VGGLVVEARKYNRIAFDTNAVIYLLEKHRIYGPEVKGVFELIEKGICCGVTSTLLITEVLTKPLKEDAYDLYHRYMAFLRAFPNLLIRDVTQSISISAAKIRARYNLKTPDAIFIATAFEEGAEVFITNDIRLSNVNNLNTIIINQYIQQDK
jgi:predicted nucleic acid-binding protein